MALSLQEISDRLELQDLVTQYADIIDRKAFSELNLIFTDDAVIDYEATGAPKCSVAEMIAFLTEAMSLFPNHQHLVSNTQFKVNTGKRPIISGIKPKLLMSLGVMYCNKFSSLTCWRSFSFL